MVTQRPLEALFMVRIHVGQPLSLDENGWFQIPCTELAEKPVRNADRRVTFPVTIEYYEQRAKIYRPAKEIPFYGVAFKVAGSRRMLTFGSCGEAKKTA